MGPDDPPDHPPAPGGVPPPGRGRPPPSTLDEAQIALDDRGRIAAASPAIEHFLGYTPAELLGKEFISLIVRVDRVLFAELLAEGARRGTRSEMDFLDCTGHRVPGELVLSPLAFGERVTLVALLRGPSRRRILGEQLRVELQATQQYRKLFETTNSMVAIADFAGYFCHVNPVWTRILGYSSDELCAVPFMSFVHPDDVTRTEAEAERLLATGSETVAFANRYRCKDGSYRWLHWNATVDRTARLTYAVAQDITDLIETRERLRRSEEILQETAHMAHVGGFELDVQARRPVFSEEIYRIYEVPSGHPLELEELVNLCAPEARPTFQRALDRATRQGEPFDLELPFMSLDGRSLWVRATGRTEQRDGKVLRLLGALQDVSQQKAAERMKSEFVSVVSHELRTPLTSIRGSLRLIEGGLMGTLPQEAMELVRVASANCERLVRLNNDILDLEKMEAGKLELRLERLDLREVVERAVSGIQGMATEAGVEIAVAIVATTVDGDTDRLLQVLTNLLSNAVKFSPRDGKVRVLAEERQRGRIRVSVSDQGPGIAPQDQARLFGKFQQLDSSDTRSKGGTGLGLAISKMIIDQHGGEIGVSSEAGRGTSFWFELPAVATPEFVRRRTRTTRRDPLPGG